jgi:hypothetical protein
MSKKNIEIDLNIPVDIEDVISSIGELDYDDIFKVIKDIDFMMQDWDFTERLYKHFKKLHEEYMEECRKDEFLTKEDFE